MGKQVKWALLWALLVFFVGGGCAPYPSETHKKLNDLNYDAGKQLSTYPDPVVAQTGADVRDNSDVLARTFIGWPVDRQKYDAALSKKVREDALKEFEAAQPWYKKAAGYLISGLTVLAIGGTLAARFFPATAPIMAIATPILSAITEMKQKADANPSDSIHINDMQPIISKLTLLPKIGPKIGEVLKDLHLDQAIHSPEAADLPVPAVA